MIKSSTTGWQRLISRLLENIGLFSKESYKRDLYFSKETNICVCVVCVWLVCVYVCCQYVQRISLLFSSKVSMSSGLVKPVQMDDKGSQQCGTKCSGVCVCMCVYVCVCAWPMCVKRLVF